MDANFLRPWLWSALFVLIGLWLLYVEVDSAAFQQCVADHGGTYPQEEAGENPAYFVAAVSLWRIKVWTSCTGAFLDTYREVVAAVATIFIAIFTWTLWWSTRRLGEFARSQADDTKRALRIADTAVQAALISADANEVLADVAKHSLENEREALRIAAETAAATRTIAEATKLHAETAREALRPRVFAQPWPHTAKVVDGEILFQMEFACYGNSPATARELSVESSDSPPRGATAVYTAKPTQISIGLAPTNRWWYPETLDEFFRTPIRRPFIFGFIRYADQFGVVRTSGYSAKLEITKDGQITLATAGDPAYSRFD